MAKAKKPRPQNIFAQNGLRLKEIKPLTDNQTDFFDKYAAGHHIFISGCPGTGKSYISLYNALEQMFKGNTPYQKILIIRSVVQGRDIGFLPGTVEEKAAVYEAPYEAIFADLFGRGDAYQVCKDLGIVEFMTTSFLRGLTFKNCIVVTDELQNATFTELNTIISRVGDNCRIIFSGDLYQTDLYKKNDWSGFIKFKGILETIPDFQFVKMDIEDIVRSLLAKKYIIARINWEKIHE